MEKIDYPRLRAFAYEVLRASFGAGDVPADDIRSLGLKLGLVFEGEAGSTGYHIHTELCSMAGEQIPPPLLPLSECS